MTVFTVLSTILTGTLLGLAAHAGERALRELGRPSRFLWIGSMVGTAAVPVLMLFSWPAEVGLLQRLTVLPIDSVAFNVEFVLRAGAVAGAPEALGRLAPAAWLAMSVVLLLGVVAVGVRTRREARDWVAAVVDGVPVVVSATFGPAVIGLVRPAIVLPAWVTSLPPAERRLVVLHEEQHLRSGDTRTLAAGALLLLLVPWNIPLWWQLRRLRLAVEVDCDQRVLDNGAERTTYAGLLLRLHERMAIRRLLPVSLAGARSRLARRIDVIAQRPTKRRLLRASLKSAAAIGLTIVAVACATVGPAQHFPSPAPTAGPASPDDASPRRVFLTSDTGPPLLYVVADRLYRFWEIDLDTLEVVSARLIKNGQVAEQYGVEARNGVAYLTLR